MKQNLHVAILEEFNKATRQEHISEHAFLHYAQKLDESLKNASKFISKKKNKKVKLCVRV